MNGIRREKIREFVEQNQYATVDQLTTLFPNVSLMTIHRDLTFLQEQGFLVKVRGGARYIADSQGEPAFAAREILGREAKQKVGLKATRFVSGSSSVFIDAGTTMLAFAKEVPNIQASIVTSGPNIALELAKKPLLTVSLCGGVLNKNNLTLSGSVAIDALSSINIDTAFTVASGYGAEYGFTCGMESEAAIKELVTRKARTSVMMLDASKLGKVLPYTFARLEDYDILITDKDPQELPAELRRAAEEAGVALV